MASRIYKNKVILCVFPVELLGLNVNRSQTRDTFTDQQWARLSASSVI